MILLVVAAACGGGGGNPAIDGPVAVPDGAMGTDGAAAVADGSPAGAADASGSPPDAPPSAIDASADEADAGMTMCLGTSKGECSDDLSCHCCPIGGPAQRCTCSTECLSDDDCEDPARPLCNQISAGVTGFCTSPEFSCCWECD